MANWENCLTFAAEMRRNAAIVSRNENKKNMTIRERIQRIATKANVPYGTISILVNSFYGKETTPFEDRIELLEKYFKIR